MFLNSISLEGFRSFKSKTVFEFDPKFTLIIGPNSVGKTNLLEGLYCLSYGHGFREKKLEELVNQESKGFLLEAEFKNNDQQIKIGVKYQYKSPLVTKTFFINQIRKSYRDFLKRTVSTVLFQPDDLLIVSHTPDLRRSYFDKTLMHTGFEYLEARRNYSGGLYKRNKLLENLPKINQSELVDLLRFWDNYLKKQALILQKIRREIVEDFNKHPALNGLEFKINYQPNLFLGVDEPGQLDQELKIRRTLSGPQLDEFVFLKLTDRKLKTLSRFGSRSEQRLFILWLKINELRFIEEQTGQKPMLLMDDIFSELDMKNSQRILKVASAYQTVVTTAHQDILPLLKKNTSELNTITLNP